MGPLQQLGLNSIERPPYYHLPRSRPVAFERHNNEHHYGACRQAAIEEASNFLRENLAPYVASSESQRHQFNQAEERRAKMHTDHQHQDQQHRVSDGEHNSYNNSARPYLRRQKENDFAPPNNHLADERQQAGGQRQQQTVPRIVVNHEDPMVLVKPYPTSTVHKSMLNRKVLHTSSSSSGLSSAATAPPHYQEANYGRLISPTLLTASYESLSPTSASSRNTASFYSTDSGRETGTQQMGGGSSGSGGGTNEQFNAATNRARSQKFAWCPPGGAAGATSEPTKGAVCGNGGNISADYMQRKLPSSSSALAVSQSEACGGGISGSNSGNGSGIGGGSGGIGGSVLVPNSKRDEYMWDRQLERVSIAHQTYRTLPIVVPKPKARHDLASGTYMRYMQDPTWELTRSRSSSLASKDHERKIQQAISHEREEEELTAGGASGGRRAFNDGSVPVFNYREYIDSTRRAAY